MEAAPRFELGVKVLQTSALPLGYAAIMERKTGLEPATPTLARWCSTTELLPQLATRIRFELTISAVTGRHVNPYTTGPQDTLIVYLQKGLLSSQISRISVRTPPPFQYQKGFLLRSTSRGRDKTRSQRLRVFHTGVLYDLY